MSRYLYGLGILSFCMLFVFAVFFTSATASASAETAPGLGPQPDPAARERAVESYGKLPLSFEANAGQADQRVKFLSRGSGYTLFLTSNEAVLALRNSASGKQKTATKIEVASQHPSSHPESRTSDILRMKLVGANPAAEISGLEQLAGTSNYFIGNDPKKWRTAVPNYAKVQYHDVYPGVDMVYYGNQRQLEYDFVVAPGADPRVIKLDFTGTVGQRAKGARRSSFLRIDRNGDLVVRLNGREFSFHKPTAYQLASVGAKATSQNAARDIVEARYVLQANEEVGIRLAPYDATRALTIDPMVVLLQYSSILGGSSIDEAHGVAVDSSRNAYVTGITESSDFPRVNQIRGACQGGCGTGGNADVFVTKINAAGSALVYSSYIGGSGDDSASGIAVDSSGNAYVTGITYSTDFPRVFPSVNQIIGACQGGCGTGGIGDAFVTKINAAGSAVVYSSYIGGSSYDEAFGVAVDSSRNVYVTGITVSSDFPSVNQIPGACQGSCEQSGAAFVTKINAAGSTLVYSSYIGGSGSDSASGIAVDSSGNAYVTGTTASSDFPIVNQIPGACQGSCGTGPYGDVFVTQINAAGGALVYSSLLGGSGSDDAHGVAVDNAGNAYVTGFTDSSDFPIVSQIPGVCLGSCGTGVRQDVFVTKINAAGGALVYSSLLGGSDEEEANAVAVDGVGNAYVTGFTLSSDFPTVNQIMGACQGSCGTGSAYSDVFVTKINAAGSAVVYSSYIGGSSYDEAFGVALDGFGSAYVAGYTRSSDFPLVHQIPGACVGTCSTGNADDAFVTRIVTILSHCCGLNP
jgi:hypothetical protein